MSKNKLKILYLQHALGYGGAAKSLLLTQSAISPYVEVFTVVPRIKTKQQKAIVSEFKNSCETTEIDIPTIYSYSERTISIKDFQKRKRCFPESLIKYINREKINILHVNSTLFSHILEPVKKHTECKVIVHLREMLPHGKTHPVDNYIVERYTKYADAIIAISDNELHFFERKKNVFIVPNPHEFSQTDELLTLANKQSAPIIIGMCANFARIKGHLVFLDAAKMIQDKSFGDIDNVEFRIIGYPKPTFSLKGLVAKLIRYGYQSEFESKVKKTGLNKLKITPFSFDIYRDFASIDIFVRPDLSGHPWGRDVIEAMALKKPVIATGTSEFFVENGITGYLVPPKNPEKLAERIMELVKDPQKRVAMGEAGYEKVRKMCDMNDYGVKLMNVYESLLL